VIRTFADGIRLFEKCLSRIWNVSTSKIRQLESRDAVFDCGSNAEAGICVRLRAAVSDLCDPRRTEAEIEAPVGFAEK
jgi:hypothetical protein